MKLLLAILKVQFLAFNVLTSKSCFATLRPTILLCIFTCPSNFTSAFTDVTSIMLRLTSQFLISTFLKVVSGIFDPCGVQNLISDPLSAAEPPVFTLSIIQPSNNNFESL